jgi:hypothetical protein
MQRNGSSASLLKRDGSENRLVDVKQLGPSALKQKVGQAPAYNQWPASRAE